MRRGPVDGGPSASSSGVRGSCNHFSDTRDLMQRTHLTKSAVLVSLLVAVAVLAAPASALRDKATQPAVGKAPSEASSDYLPGRIVVKGRQAEILSHIVASTARWQTQITGQLAQLSVTYLQVPPGTEKAVLAQLQSDPGVEYAELDYRVQALESPDDERWPDQWALHTIQAAQAWDITHCQGIVVAVLDTGIHLEHPDLRSVLWTNMGEIPANGVDDDGNGKADDVHGWHFYQNCNTGACVPQENGILQDDNGHGTHVAGIIAAQAGNGIGIAGVSWGAQAMTVKVLDQYGDGYYSDVAAGMIYAADNGAKVINLSLGGAESSQLLQDAINYAHHQGVLIVAAAGNDGGNVLYPAACDHVMAVAASDRDDQRAGFSNYGPQVDIAAPGDGILSTWPWLDGYYHKRGTSMAAAHVSGAAALLWSWRPDFSNAQIEHRLASQADDVNVESDRGYDPYLGWGRLNVYQALAGLSPGPTLTPSPTITPTPSATQTPTPHLHLLRLLPVFKNYQAP
jgi:subtilisin family serine protease